MNNSCDDKNQPKTRAGKRKTIVTGTRPVGTNREPEKDLTGKCE